MDMYILTDLEFEVGSYTCFVDILCVEPDYIDYMVTATIEIGTQPYYDLDDDELKEEVREYCIKIGLLNRTPIKEK